MRSTVKYLGLYLDQRLTCGVRILKLSASTSISNCEAWPGFWDANLNSYSQISCSCTNACSNQYGHMVFSSGAVWNRPIHKSFSGYSPKSCDP